MGSAIMSAFSCSPDSWLCLEIGQSHSGFKEIYEGKEIVVVKKSYGFCVELPTQDYIIASDRKAKDTMTFPLLCS